MVIGINSGGGGGFTFQQLDLSMLGSYYEAQAALRSGTAAVQSGPASNRGPAIETPWDNKDDAPPLERRINQIRNTTSFIDPRSADVRQAGDDKDVQALFTLYLALDRLKAIADYTAQSTVTDATRGPLDILMQRGLQEVRDFISASDLDKLDLIVGKKSNRVETTVALGRTQTRFVGQAIQAAGRNDPIAGINGDEIFTVTIKKGGLTQDFEINLGEIAGPVTMNSLVSHINARIAAVQATDAEGAPLFDDNGNPVPRFGARFTIDDIPGKGLALAVSGLVGEEVSLSAAAAEPSLFLAGSSRPTGLNTEASASLTRLDGVGGDTPRIGLQQSISGVGTGIREVPEESETTDPLNGRSNSVVENIRKQVSDLIGELDQNEGEDDALVRPAVETTAAAVAVDSKGHVYTVGTTVGDFGSAVNRSEGGDVYLSKSDASGNVIWQRLLGASGTADGFALTIDGDDNVIVAGSVDGTMTGNDLFRGQDSFVSKYSEKGDRLWMRQLDTAANDAAYTVTVDANNDIYVAGQASGVFHAGASHGGGRDAYVMRLAADTGAIAATTQFGGGGHESAKAVAMAADGNVLVAVEEDGRAILRKLDRDDLANVLWSQDLGALGTGGITGLAVEGGSIYVAGHTTNGGFGGGAVAAAHGGGSDGFVVRVEDLGGSGNPAWTSFVGGASGDYIRDIAVSGGQVYVAGHTFGELGATAKAGLTDAFAARLDGENGAAAWIEQIAAAGETNAAGLAFAPAGNSVLTALGLGPGTLQVSQTRDVVTQTTARPGDYFYISINGGAKQRVTIREGDTYERIASRINRLSLRHVSAEVSFGSAGRTLKISTKNDGEIQIFAGDGDRDALRSLGLEETRILPTSKIYSREDENAADKKRLGGVFDFKLESGLSVTTEGSARYIAGILKDAVAEVQRGYRSLFPNPLDELLSQSGSGATGPVPPALAKQLANYQSGLQRLIAGGGGYVA